MNITSLLGAISAPNDLWNNLITWFQGNVGNIGWAILILTILVKLVTSPLDFFVKYSTKKQTLVQQKCAPQVAKLQKKFGSDQQTLRIQTNALYKREGLNMGASCIVMLINMVLTCAIFFSFYSSLRTISAYQTINQYEMTYEAYETSFTNYVYETKLEEDNTFTIERAVELIENYETSYNYVNNPENEINDPQYNSNYALHQLVVTSNEDLMEDATKTAADAALKTWNDNKSSWLWIQNIWVADAPTYPFPNFDSLKSSASEAGSYYSNYVNENISQNEYTIIANFINSNASSYNGYYILAALAGIITFLSQYISDLHNKLKNKKANTLASATNTQATGSMKVMKIILPIIMIMFVLSSSASFGIYLLASNVASIALGEIINLLVNKFTKRKRLEVEEFLEKEADRLIKKGKLQG